MDAEETHLLLDRLFATFTLETVLSEVVLPYLHELGGRWSRGEASVTGRFASNLIRGRLMSLARSWGTGGGPLAVLACAPGEQHDLPLVAFGLALRGRGWRIAFLGADTPAVSMADAAEMLDPALLVVGAMTSEAFERSADELADLARSFPLAIAGAGASSSSRKGSDADSSRTARSARRPPLRPERARDELHRDPLVPARPSRPRSSRTLGGASAGRRSRSRDEA